MSGYRIISTTSGIYEMAIPWWPALHYGVGAILQRIGFTVP
jgi:hypothetical protein